MGVCTSIPDKLHDMNNVVRGVCTSIPDKLHDMNNAIWGLQRQHELTLETMKKDNHLKIALIVAGASVAAFTVYYYKDVMVEQLKSSTKREIEQGKCDVEMATLHIKDKDAQEQRALQERLADAKLKAECQQHEMMLGFEQQNKREEMMFQAAMEDRRTKHEVNMEKVKIAEKLIDKGTVDPSKVLDFLTPLQLQDPVDKPVAITETQNKPCGNSFFSRVFGFASPPALQTN